MGHAAAVVVDRDPFADAHLISDSNNRFYWRLDDGRFLTEAQMLVRERQIRAGLDPDAGFEPDADRVDDTLGHIVVIERLERGLSQRALASVAGVTQSMVARLERGSREPSWRTFRMLLDAMALQPVVTVQTTAPSSSSDEPPPSDGGPSCML